MNTIDNYAMPVGALREVHWMTLTPHQVACWYSHVSVICSIKATAGPMRPSIHPCPNMTLRSHLHPAYSPYCTHTYILSGIYRLLQHLQHTPFAYSHALDHVFSWLIESGCLRVYSVMPSITLQTKDMLSSILLECESEQTQ